MGVRRLAILSLILWTATAGAQSKRLPDVYLVTIDTLRADHVGCYGDTRVQTPALDRLCKDGLRFAQAFTPSPITNSSHASILTGLMPSTHGVTDFAVPLRSGRPTLAEMLHGAGYHTAAFIGAVILDSRTLAPGFDRGFDFYFNFPGRPAGKSRYGRVERRGMTVVQRAEQWIAQARGPRFAWVHLYDPHDPYDPPPPYLARYRDRPYDGEIAYADSALAEFLRFLDRRGLYRDAIIIVVGDHGEGLGEHGEDTHGIFLYDSTLHVPLIVKLSRHESSGAVIAAQVRTIDIVPTLVDVLQLPVTSQFEGATLRPFWSAHGAVDRVALGETDYPLRFGWAPLRSVRSGAFKYIEAPRPELYDLNADRGESINIYQPWVPEVQRLRKVLADADLRPGAAQASAVPPATVAELRALGYLGNDPGVTTANPGSLLPDPKDKIAEQNLLHRAMLADEDGNLAATRAALHKVLELDPSSPTGLLQYGDLELRAGNHREAAGLLARAREVRPDDAGAAWSLGRALYQLGEYGQARQALESSLKLRSGQFEARILLASTCTHLGDLAAAEDQLEAAILLEPRDAGARKQLGSVRFLKKDYDGALAALDEAARLAPRDASIYDELGRVYRAHAKPVLAQQAEARASRLRTQGSVNMGSKGKPPRD
ncbi:MAG: sulfatase-like hydrolase/transferase [Acidobacteriota bacterium]|nr:sulfatase-like hydrolase/transferase [Acidobacteriota bacterium]